MKNFSGTNHLHVRKQYEPANSFLADNKRDKKVIEISPQKGLPAMTPYPAPRKKSGPTDISVSGSSKKRHRRVGVFQVIADAHTFYNRCSWGFQQWNENDTKRLRVLQSHDAGVNSVTPSSFNRSSSQRSQRLSKDLDEGEKWRKSGKFPHRKDEKFHSKSSKWN